MKTFVDIYKDLASIDCSSFTEKKKDLNYLSWSHAWHNVASRYSASYEVVRFDWKPYFFDESLGYYVETRVTIDWHTRTMQLFVMDWANNAMSNKSYTYTTKYWDKTVEKATMFEINTAIMRCLTKNLALFGLGINIYAGEDLPLLDEDWNHETKNIAKKPAPAKVDTPNGGTKPKTETSPDEYCQNCGEHCETKKWTTKDGRHYELWECASCSTKFFVNRKDKSAPAF